MKIVILVAMAGLALAQSQAVARVFVVDGTGRMQFVKLDPATLAVVNGVLSVIPPAAVKLPARVVEITQVAAATPTYTLGQAQSASPDLDVFWNGLCLSAGVDYTVAGSVVTFVNPPGAGDVLRVVYRGT